jgi:hypothetical protein
MRDVPASGEAGTTSRWQRNRSSWSFLPIRCSFHTSGESSTSGWRKPGDQASRELAILGIHETIAALLDNARTIRLDAIVATDTLSIQVTSEKRPGRAPDAPPDLGLARRVMDELTIQVEDTCTRISMAKQL